MNLIPILQFLLNLKIKEIFNENLILANSMRVLFFIYSAAVGVVISHLSNFSMIADSYLLNLVLIASISVFPLIFNIVFYKPKTHLIPDIYPLKVLEKVVIELIYDLVNYEYIGSLLVIIFYCINSNESTWYQFIYLVLIIIHLSMIINLTKLVIERECNPKVLCYVYYIMSVLVFFVLNLYVLLHQFSFTFLMFLLSFTIMSSIVLYLHAKSQIRHSITTIDTSDIYDVRLLWDNKDMKKIIIVYILGKILTFLGISYLIFSQKTTVDGYILTYSLITILPFTVTPIFSNFWGFCREIWLVIQLNANNNIRFTFKIYAKSLVPFISMDIIITSLWFYYMNLFVFSYFVFYIVIMVLFFFLGYILSMIYPYFHKQYPNTLESIIISFLFVFVTGLFINFINHKILFWILFVVMALLMSYQFFFKLENIKHNKKYINYKNLFNF